MPALILTPLPNIPLIRPGNNLAEFLLKSLREADIPLQDGDILVLAQKIVSKAENRLVNLATVSPSAAALELAAKTGKDPRIAELLLQESHEILRARIGTAIVEHRLGFVCANAGIDQSNVGGSLAGKTPNEEMPGEWVLLLPEDPDQSAARIRAALEAASGKKLGVLVIDSHGRAWRLGTVGVAIGLSGLPGLVDERGWQDLFGYTLKITVLGAADELAAAASLVMGQAAEGTPAVHVRGFPYPLREGSLAELLRPKEQDMFR
ncbi:MAG: coenzyme F420-0:L-glutamate ligase [Anaerolineales bacterium]|nr:coenzyme F420-0:L-glutamate ligase [Anaerolineales bacterium]